MMRKSGQQAQIQKTRTNAALASSRFWRKYAMLGRELNINLGARQRSHENKCVQMWLWWPLVAMPMMNSIWTHDVQTAQAQGSMDVKGVNACVPLQVLRQAVPCQLTSSRVCEMVEEYRQAWVTQDPARTGKRASWREQWLQLQKPWGPVD